MSIEQICSLCRARLFKDQANLLWLCPRCHVLSRENSTLYYSSSSPKPQSHLYSSQTHLQKLEGGATCKLAQRAFVEYWPKFFDTSSCRSLFEELTSSTQVQWMQRADVEETSPPTLQPRLTAFEASSKYLVYNFAGLDNPLIPSGSFSPAVAAIKQEVDRFLNTSFNTAYLNWYRSGEDHLSWHTDEDVELYGPEPLIASVSFGAPRDFVLRKMKGKPFEWREDETVPHIGFRLAAGDLLVMSGRTQRYFEHCVRKLPEEKAGARVNLTFRFDHRIPESSRI